jgi:chemotaxis signal transduction protein
LNIVPVEVCGFWLALPADVVQEILGRRSWVTIPGAPSELPGVLAWRGRAIGVFDLGRVVDGGEAMAVGESRRRILVIQYRACTMAIPVDNVREVQQLPAERAQPAQQTHQRFAHCEVELDGMPLPLLDVDALFAAIAAPDESP